MEKSFDKIKKYSHEVQKSALTLIKDTSKSHLDLISPYASPELKKCCESAIVILNDKLAATELEMKAAARPKDPDIDPSGGKDTAIVAKQSVGNNNQMMVEEYEKIPEKQAALEERKNESISIKEIWELVDKHLPYLPKDGITSWLYDTSERDAMEIQQESLSLLNHMPDIGQTHPQLSAASNTQEGPKHTTQALDIIQNLTKKVAPITIADLSKPLTPSIPPSRKKACRVTILKVNHHALQMQSLRLRHQCLSYS